LLDAEGRPLQPLSPTVVAGVRPGKLQSAAATAQALGAATNIDPTEIRGWILAAPRKGFLELVTLKPSQYRHLAKALRKVPGLVIQHSKMRLFKSTAPAVVGSVGTEVSPTLRNEGIAYRPGATVGLSPGLQYHYQDYLAGTPTTEVVTETAAGHQVKVLKTWNGRRPAAVHTTLDAGVQSAATRAVNSSRGSAAIVAMQATNGHILAVANHTRRGLPSIDPLAGHYPPGGAFTIISTEALLANGLQEDAVEPCLRSNTLGGQNFRNVPAVPNLGKNATFALDFAHSCGTAFSALSARPGMRQHLADAARGFGLGTPWSLPLPSFSGQVGDPGGVAQLAAATMGQGSVQVSPLTMAAVAAQVDTGMWHQPSLVTKPDPQRTQQVRFSASTMDSLRGLMYKAVQSGAARLADVTGKPVYGQVGTTLLSGHGRHRRWAAWFVGYRGDIAFAAVVFSASPHVSAVRLAAAFLRTAPAR
jgi:cell division protein FtsI/penicillin-binding protein 2